MDSQSHDPQFVSCSSVPGDNGFPAIPSSPIKSARTGEVKRETKEKKVSLKINLDGNGVSDSSTGISFLDHMLDQLASHGLFDVHVRAAGDIHIDDHHTNEDVALAIGTALLKALGERKGINRFGDFTAPLDEALIHVTLDLSGRPYLGYNLEIPTQRLVEHFFQSLVNTSGKPFLESDLLTRFVMTACCGCSSLVGLPPSIGNATNLQTLNLTECSSLVEFPSSIVNAVNLQTLDLSGCSSLAVMALRDSIKRHLKLPHAYVMEYKPHDASLRDISSYRNTWLRG